MDTKELIVLPKENMMLTTLDNPYSPRDDYKLWRKWDYDNLHFTEELIARVADIPLDIEDPATTESIIENAVLFILENDVEEKYKLI